MNLRTYSSSLAIITALISAGLVSAPLHAQNGGEPLSLEDLIPENAVENPEDWAADGVVEEAAIDMPASPEIAQQTPIAPPAAVTEIDLAWPEALELAPPEPLPVAEDPIEFAQFEDVTSLIEIGREYQLSDDFILAFPQDEALFPQSGEFISRFNVLLAAQQVEGAPQSNNSDEDSDAEQANIARNAQLANASEALFSRLLGIYGYFDARIVRTLAAQNGQTRFEILPGKRYSIGEITLGNLAATGAELPQMRESFTLQSGDLLALDAIEGARVNLDNELGENGYPFALVPDPDLVVDHQRELGDLAVNIEPGGKYYLGEITSSLPDFLSGRHLSSIANFELGDLYQRSNVEDLRRAILATGLVGSVALTPVPVTQPEGETPGTLALEADITKAPLRTFAAGLGYGTEEGFRLEGSWEHRNLLPPEGALRVRGILGTQEQLAGITLRKNNFRGRDRILTLDAYAATIDYDAYDATTLSMLGTYEKISTLLLQKPFSWSVGVELVATRENERDANGNRLPSDTFFIAALPLYAQIDRSDDLLDPVKGWRLSGNISPEISSSNGTQSFYFRNQMDASFYQQIDERVVLAGRLRLGSIPGASLDAIAPSRRLYAGGGGSVRGYGYREIGPLNASGDLSGGRSLAEFSLEARVGTDLFDGALGFAAFVDAGSVGLDSVPDFEEVKYGAGVGARYDSGFGPLRFDVAFPINPGPNDNWIAVYIALGQAF